MNKIIIAAVAENGVIGKDGQIPWHFPKDLQHFREETVGETVVMGRKTFQSLPDSFKPLPDRENIVLSRSDFSPENKEVKIAKSLDKAWKKATNKEVYIIGGARVYRQTLEQADRMILTEIKQKYEGDTYFPNFSTENWKEKTREKYDEFDFVEYTPK